MGTFLEFLRSLGTVRLAIMGVVFFSLILLFVFLTTRLTGTSMDLLFSNLETSDSNLIITELQQQNIPYEVRNEGSEIFVPRDKVGTTRISLASQGLPSGKSVGYEIFDNNSALGTTNFMQNISLVRALEGELARTIRSLKSVHSARVHLVLPKRQMFSREKQLATASVILKMRGSDKLTGERIAAVQHLVASAVPELDATRVAIVDDKGNLLARGDESDTVQANSLIEHKIALELRLTRELTELLSRSVGPGKVHVRVDADLDFDRISSTEETYDPDGQVVRSTRTIDESQTSEESDGQAVTVQNNLPDAQGGGGQKASSSEAKNDEQVNFEISKKITNHAREVGAIKRLSVAVLVDGEMVKNANGQMDYKPRPPAEMENLAKLVSSAIGIDRARGDTLEVINMKFAPQVEDTDQASDLLFGFQRDDILRIAEIMVLGILAILVILLVVRPLVSKAFESMPTPEEEDQKLIEDGALATPALAGPESSEPDLVEELIDIERIEGRVKASAVKKVEDFIQEHPEEALSIIRTWMYQET